MTNTHKISVDRGCLAVICTDDTCSFKKTCSSHTTAGDFRSEDGFTPELHLVDGDVYCGTYNQKIDDNDKYGFYPVNYRSLDIGLLTWKQLEEIRDKYNAKLSHTAPPSGPVSSARPSMDERLLRLNQATLFVIKRAGLEALKSRENQEN